jgi:hypothetical protein
MRSDMQTQQRVFDDIVRTDTTRAGRSDGLFEYMNRSARPRAEQARAIIEAWFDRLPDDEKPEFRTRLRQTDDRHFRAALFELYLHELLLRSRFTVEFHPPSEKGKRLDFKVHRDRVSVFYMEARVAGDSAERSAKQRIVDAAYDALDRMPCPDFFLYITVEGEPTSPVPVRKGLRMELEHWIGGLDYDALAAVALAGRMDLLPSYEWAHEGWRLVIRVDPKKPEARGKPGVRPIGVVADGTALCARTDEMISNAVADKAGRYGKLDLPYVVAVNVLDQTGVDGDDIWSGLTKALGGQRTTVSAVLIVPELWHPLAARDCSPTLVHNPRAMRPLSSDLWPLAQFTLGQKNIEEIATPALTAGQLLDLLDSGQGSSGGP